MTNTEHTHTPGPWRAVRGKRATKPDRWHISCPTHVVATTAGESEANARLIAAAPQMLAALRSAEVGAEELCLGQHSENECWETLAEIRAAIAKATA